MNSETIIQLVNLLASADSGASPQAGRSSSHPYIIGAKYFVRTATHYVAGKLVAVGEQELTLEDASWIADTGRFTAAMASGDFEEVEMFANPVIVGRGAIIDATQISKLPTEQK